MVLRHTSILSLALPGNQGASNENIFSWRCRGVPRTPGGAAALPACLAPAPGDPEAVAGGRGPASLEGIWAAEPSRPAGAAPARRRARAKRVCGAGGGDIPAPRWRPRRPRGEIRPARASVSSGREPRGRAPPPEAARSPTPQHEGRGGAPESGAVIGSARGEGERRSGHRWAVPVGRGDPRPAAPSHPSLPQDPGHRDAPSLTPRRNSKRAAVRFPP